MAQKAAKHTARRNVQILNRAHAVAVVVHLLFLLSRVLLFRNSFGRSSLALYVFLSLPSFAIELVFEFSSRPKYGTGAEVRSSGQDLEASGLTEWMWDVLYWTWGCILLAAIFGDSAWWLWLAIPLYSLWLAWKVFSGARQSFAPGASGTGSGNDVQQGSSKRQKKLGRQGGQR